MVSKLAAKLSVQCLHRTTFSRFSEAMIYLFNHVDSKTKIKTTNLSPYFIEKVRQYAHLIDQEIRSDHDFDFDYFGFKTLEK
jgi:hypothetical protein